MFEIGNRIEAKSPLRKKGFSMIEIIVVLAIIGVMAAVLFPAIINSLETRFLESTAKEIVSSMMRAKFQAVKVKWEALGFKVLSPLDHPDGLNYEEYMRRSLEYVFDCKRTRLR